MANLVQAALPNSATRNGTGAVPFAAGQYSATPQQNAILGQHSGIGSPVCSPAGGVKPMITNSQFNLVAVVTSAITVYLPSFDNFAELISGHPTSLEGATNAVTHSSIFFVQELFDFGNEPSSTTDGIFGGEYTYTNATANVLGAVAPTTASAFMRRCAMLPMYIVGVQMATAESTQIITTLYGYYGNLTGNTGFNKKLNTAQIVSGSNTLYTNNQQWWLTGNTQLYASIPVAGTFRWTFFVGGYGDNFSDVSSN